MSFLAKLFSKRKPYVHPVFGTMNFIKIGGGKSYWEGEAVFGPTKRMVEVFVDGDDSGVCAGAVEFFEEVQRRYQSIISKFRPEIDRQMALLSRNDIPKEFESAYLVSSVSVVAPQSGNEWSLGFECLFDEGFSVSIEMSGWESGGVVVDS